MHLDKSTEGLVVTRAGFGHELGLPAGKCRAFGPLGDEVEEGLNARDR